MNTKYLTIGLSFCCLFMFTSAEISGQSRKAENGINPKTDPRVLLNLWVEPSSKADQLFKLAYDVLSARSEANYADLWRNAKFNQFCRENSIIQLGGPMLGNISPNGVHIWMRTVKQAKIEVNVTAKGFNKTFGPIFSSETTDLSAVVAITGLVPETSYRYQVTIDGEELPSTSKQKFRTTGTQNNLNGRIAFGSCFHRWGLGNQKQSDLIVSRQPDALLLMGDVAVQDRMNNTGMHRADYLMRDFVPAWQKLVATVPVYDTWDDHDYFNNDLSGIPKGFTKEDKEKVWKVFRFAWNNPAYGFGEDGKGVFFRTRIGPADVIMLDNRYFRNGEKGSFLGDEQMNWLKGQLSECKGPFIILSCGTMWNDYVSNGKDSWGTKDPDGREELFNFIEKNNISGILLISGDRHGARGFRIPRPSGFNFYEFGAASLGGNSGPAPTSPEWEGQLYGMSGKYAFGEFTFDSDGFDPKVIFRLIGDDGTILFEQKLRRSQLTPKGK